MAEEKQPERAADAQPAAEEPVTNSEDAQEAVDVYKAGVANANAAAEDTVVVAEPAAAPPPAAPADDNPVVERT